MTIARQSVACQGADAQRDYQGAECDDNAVEEVIVEFGGIYEAWQAKGDDYAGADDAK